MINQNTKITQELKKSFGMSELTGYPRKVSEAILPVVEVNNKYCNFAYSGILQNATSATIWTTPTDRDFYLYGAALARCGDATAESTFTSIQLTPESGQWTVILNLPGVASQIQSEATSVNFTIPIKLQRGTTINLTHTKATATIRGAASIWGYLDEVTGD